MRIRFSHIFPLHRVLLFWLMAMLSPAVLADEPFSSVDSMDVKQINWYNLDPVADTVQRCQRDKTYREILHALPPGKKVVVAVIDGGVDIQHSELKGRIWTNADEKADNGIDDDNNGYVMIFMAGISWKSRRREYSL